MSRQGPELTFAMQLALQGGKSKPSKFSDYVMVVGAVAVFVAGTLFTASVFFSPEHEVNGVISHQRIRGVKSKSYMVTLTMANGERVESSVSRSLYGSVAVNDRVRWVYRDWDDEPTLVEILDGPRGGRVWKQGLLDVVMGPIAILFGAGAAFLLIRNLKSRTTPANFR